MRFVRSLLIVSLSVVAVFVLFQISTAGSLTPAAVPGGTMHSFQEVYDAMVGTFDSSAIVANSTGNAMQMSKCIIARIRGEACP